MNNNFLTSFADTLGKGIEERNKSKLALMLHSSQIEQQLMGKALEKQLEDQMGIGQVSPEQAGGLLGLVGAPPDAGNTLSGLFGHGKTVPEKLLTPIAGALGASQRVPQYMPSDAGMDENGNKLTRIFNKRTGKWETSATPTGGFSGTAATDITKTKASAAEMRGIIDLVDKNVKELITASGASGLPEQAARNKINQYLQNDKGAAKAYADTVAAHRARFNLAMSKNPRLAASIQEQTAGEFANQISDLAPTWERKKQQLYDLVDVTEKSTMGSHGLKPAKQVLAPNAPLSPEEMRKALGL